MARTFVGCKAHKTSNTSVKGAMVETPRWFQIKRSPKHIVQTAKTQELFLKGSRSSVSLRSSTIPNKAGYSLIMSP